MDLKSALALIKSYQDFPKPGITFQDVHPVVYHPEARKAVLDHLTARYRDYKLDAIVALDSRGYYFGMLLAVNLELPFVPARKCGKLPGSVKAVSYDLEYGSATIEIQEGVLKPGARVLIVDDLMATGGTAAGACKLVQELGATVVEVHVMVELLGLNGRSKLPADVPLYELVQL